MESALYCSVPRKTVTSLSYVTTFQSSRFCPIPAAEGFLTTPLFKEGAEACYWLLLSLKLVDSGSSENSAAGRPGLTCIDS